MLTVYAGFCLLWGVGYNTDGFREKSGLTTAPVTADQLAQVTAYFADQLALSAGEVPRDGDGVCRLDYRQLLTGSKIDRVCCGAVKIFMGNKSSPFCTFLQNWWDLR